MSKFIFGLIMSVCLMQMTRGAATPGLVIEGGVVKRWNSDVVVTDIVIPEGVTKIADNAFSGWDIEMCRNITSVTFPSSLKVIGEYAFFHCEKLTQVTWGDSLESIGGNAFSNSGLAGDIVLPEGLRSVGYHAFARTDITSVRFPSSLETLGWATFSKCTMLTDVYFAGNAPLFLPASSSAIAPGVLYDGTPQSLVTHVLEGTLGWGTSGLWPKCGSPENVRTLDYYGKGAPPPMWLDPVVVEDAYEDATGRTLNGRIIDRKTCKIVALIRLDLGEVSDGISTVSAQVTTPDGKTRRFGKETVSVFDGMPAVLQASIGIFGDMTLVIGGDKFAGMLGDYLVQSVEAPGVAVASAYSGYLDSGDGVIGLFEVKVAKKRDTVSVTVQLPTASGSRALKKFSYTGILDGSGRAVLVCKKNGGTMELTFDEKSVAGTVMQGGMAYGITGGLATKDVLESVDSLNGKVWSVVLHTPSEGVAHPLLNGYSYLTVTAGKKGKVKIAGVLADGTKVSASAQGAVFGSSVVVPLNVALYKGKTGGFSLKLKIEGDALAVDSVSEWTAVIDGETVSAKWDAVHVSKKSELQACAAFRLDTTNVPLRDYFPMSMNGTPALPENLPFDAAGGKWKLPKAGKVVFTKDKSDLDVLQFGKNPSGLKLSYTAKTGTFKGSFALYRELKPGTLKKVTVAVNGTVVSGTGYGSAVIKGIGAIPVTIVSAASEFAYELVDGNAVITDYLGLGPDVVFPAMVDGHPVLEIAETAFYYGFYFGTYPFVNVAISEGIQKTGHAAFGYSTELETFLIPSTLAVFGDSNGAEFLGCLKLRRVDVADGNVNFKSVDGVLYDKSETMLIYCPASKAPGETFIVPETVARIAEHAFNCSRFKSVILPETLTEIEESVFSCAHELVSMDIPPSVKSIGRWAFEYCYALESVTIPPSVTSIGEWAFAGCHALKTVYVSPGDAERVAALYPFESEVEFVEIGASASPQR